MSFADPEFAEAVRASDRAHGLVAVEVEIDELTAADQDELRSYIRAWSEGRIREADHIARMQAHARMLADQFSEMLPEGMRFEWK